MRVIFLGTPDFAVNSLLALNNSRHEVVAVVTQPDRPVGRKAVITPSPVKSAALSLGLKVLQYNKISSEGVDELKALNADIMVTCAFGQILSREVLNAAKHGVINVHASLLPKYRGAAPIQAAILNGDKETGVTIMQTVYELDAGDILAVEKVPIGEDENAGELFEKLSDVGARLLCGTLDDIEDGRIIPIKQNGSEATFVKPIKKSDAIIDWEKPSFEIKNQVRAYSPWPVAFTYLNGKILKIFSVELTDVPSFDAAGVVDTDGGIFVCCGDNLLKIKELQEEGGKKMTAKDFLLGRKIKKGDRFENA